MEKITLISSELKNKCTARKGKSQYSKLEEKKKYMYLLMTFAFETNAFSMSPTLVCCFLEKKQLIHRHHFLFFFFFFSFDFLFYLLFLFDECRKSVRKQEKKEKSTNLLLVRLHPRPLSLPL